MNNLINNLYLISLFSVFGFGWLMGKHDADISNIADVITAISALATVGIAMKALNGWKSQIKGTNNIGRLIQCQENLALFRIRTDNIQKSFMLDERNELENILEKIENDLRMIKKTERSFRHKKIVQIEKDFLLHSKYFKTNHVQNIDKSWNFGIKPMSLDEIEHSIYELIEKW